MNKIKSQFTFDDINSFINVIQEIYEIAKIRAVLQHRDADWEIMNNCISALRELEQLKSRM
ncbi:MAG: hypothetical protein ACTSVY_11820 [Candidatus Helarchaeota archaeon]